LRYLLLHKKFCILLVDSHLSVHFAPCSTAQALRVICALPVVDIMAAALADVYGGLAQEGLGRTWFSPRDGDVDNPALGEDEVQADEGGSSEGGGESGDGAERCMRAFYTLSFRNTFRNTRH
jgi:hypothetical protein